MTRQMRVACKIVASLILFSLAQVCLFAQTVTTTASTTTVSPVANPCPRFAAGSVVHQPPALFSVNGTLNVQFSYQTTTDFAGRTLYCFMTPGGLENPTLHVRPGDHLILTSPTTRPPSP